jgi:hypothetical protein
VLCCNGIDWFINCCLTSREEYFRYIANENTFISRGLFQECMVRTNYDIYFFYTYHLVNTSAGWLLVPDSIMLPLVGILALTCFIRYICIAIHIIIIIIKSKVLLPQTRDRSQLWLFRLCHLVIFAPKRVWVSNVLYRTLLKVISETRHAH